MDVILFNPAPRKGWAAQPRVELPLSLLCPAAPLDRQGYRIALIDQYADPDWEQRLNEAMREKPICFGVTCMTGPQILRALEACRIFRRRYPDVPIVWGGVHASLMPAQTIAHEDVDIIVVGEGEAAFEEVVKAIQHRTPLGHVRGIWYKENGKVIATGGGRTFIDLNAEPPLPYHLINMDRYRRPLFGVDHISFNSSRGCVFRCSFCWDPVMHRRQWRAMNPETVLDHVSRIVRDYGIRGFLFTDDHFFIDMDRAYNILDLLVKSNLDVTISKLQIRADTICRMDRDFLDLLVRAKVKRMTVGIESGCQRVLDLIKKDVTVEQVLEAGRKIADYPIVPLYLFMMGLPTEEPHELEQTIRLAEQLVEENPRAVKSFNIYTPYPGTELYQVAVQQGLKEPATLEGWAEFNFRNVARNAPWIPPATKRLVQGLDFPLMFLGKGHFVSPYKKTNRLVVALAQMYYPLARYRVRRMDVRWPLESRLAKRLGLYGRQD